VHNGGHREGRQGAGAFFSVIARPEVLAGECHHQVYPASEKVVCERDVQAHQARSSPGATQKAGLLPMSPMGPWLRKNVHEPRMRRIVFSIVFSLVVVASTFGFQIYEIETEFLHAD